MRSLFDLAPIWGGCGERAAPRATAQASGWLAAYFSVGEFAFARLMRAGEAATEALADALTAYPDAPTAAAVVRTFEAHNGPGMITA